MQANKKMRSILQDCYQELQELHDEMKALPEPQFKRRKSEFEDRFAQIDGETRDLKLTTEDEKQAFEKTKKICSKISLLLADEANDAYKEEDFESIPVKMTTPKMPKNNNTNKMKTFGVPVIPLRRHDKPLPIPPKNEPPKKPPKPNHLSINLSSPSTASPSTSSLDENEVEPYGDPDYNEDIPLPQSAKRRGRGNKSVYDRFKSLVYETRMIEKNSYEADGTVNIEKSEEYVRVSKRKVFLILILVLIFLCAVIGVLVYLSFSNPPITSRNQETTSTTNTPSSLPFSSSTTFSSKSSNDFNSGLTTTKATFSTTNMVPLPPSLTETSSSITTTNSPKPTKKCGFSSALCIRFGLCCTS